MKRRLEISVLILAIVGGGWLVSDWFQQALMRLLKLTTADPASIGLVASSSMQPIDVTVGSTFQLLAGNRDASGKPVDTETLWEDSSIVFRVPAAYVSAIGKSRDEKFPWLAEFKMWNESFEPFNLDLVAHQEDRKRHGLDPNDPLESEDALAKKRRKDFALEVQIRSPYTRDPDWRNAWIERKAFGIRTPQPCERTYDADLDMVRIKGAPDIKPRANCLGSDRADAVNYLKKNTDGSSKFFVECRGGRSRCYIQGFMEGWTLRIYVPGDRPPSTFDATFDRATQFLRSHLKANLNELTRT